MGPAPSGDPVLGFELPLGGEDRVASWDHQNYHGWFSNFENQYFEFCWLANFENQDFRFCWWMTTPSDQRRKECP